MKKLFAILLLIPFLAPGQNYGNLKFGNVSAKDFAVNYYQVDSSAEAVVISDIGSTKLEGNNKGWFSLVFRHYRRAHIRSKNAFDLANLVIPIYKDENGEVKIDKIKVSTYNLENGKVVETKLDSKDDLFEEKITKNYSIKKLTFPNLKEGSIIEFDYTTKSDFILEPEPWEFQGTYPRLWSEYKITVPVFLYYVMQSQGYFNFDAEKREDGYSTYNIRRVNDALQTENFSVSAGTAGYSWILKNAPAIRNENFTASIENHIQKIGFQLSETRDPLNFHQYIESWPQVTSRMLESSDFGLPLKQDKAWMEDIIAPLRQGSRGKLEIARNIYYFISNNITCTNYNSIYVNKTLKEVFKTRNGNVAEINALLISMLNHEEIIADPVILSTRPHGIVVEDFPMLSRFNYVICRTRIDGKSYMLDATEPRLGFGFLPLRCYNGRARIVNPTADQIYLNADAVLENKETVVSLLPDGKGGFKGSFSQRSPYYSSLEIRRRLKEKGKDDWQKELQKAAGSMAILSNLTIDSIDKLELPLRFKFDLQLNPGPTDIIYLDPFIMEGYKQNPFKAPSRYYPIEMPFGFDESYTLNIEIPEGYELDEIPKDVSSVMGSKNDGVFEYHTTVNGSKVSIKSRVYLRRANYDPGEYAALRNFFSGVVNKEAQQLVFKKKK